MTLQLVTDTQPTSADQEYRRGLFWTCNDPEEAFEAIRFRDERILQLERLNSTLAERIDQLEKEARA